MLRILDLFKSLQAFAKENPVQAGGGAVGLFFSGWLLVTFLFGAFSYITDPPKESAEHAFHLHPKEEVSFSFDGPFGKFDHAQVQRGYQVYKEVCSACHSMKRVAFADLNGIGYTPGQIKTLASSTETPSINPDTGEVTTRKSLPSDHFPSPYANETAARAGNGGALPPDLSLIAKARHGGSAYIYSLLTGYADQPAALVKEFPDYKTPAGKYYNPYFANLNVAMPPPLNSDGQVTYGEGSPKATKDQMAKDVAAFLMWAAEPKLENRHAAGIPALLFLLVFAGLCWGAYQTVWADKKH
jgi:ubiquinol-cytochrome c reductase cytochrome c1 subunit